MIAWVKLNRYCELTGDTEDGFHAKCRRHQLDEGLHYKKADDGRIWVNLRMIEEWVELGIHAQRAKHARRVA